MAIRGMEDCESVEMKAAGPKPTFAPAAWYAALMTPECRKTTMPFPAASIATWGFLALAAASSYSVAAHVPAAERTLARIAAASVVEVCRTHAAMASPFPPIATCGVRQEINGPDVCPAHSVVDVVSQAPPV